MLAFDKIIDSYARIVPKKLAVKDETRSLNYKEKKFILQLVGISLWVNLTFINSEPIGN